MTSGFRRPRRPSKTSSNLNYPLVDLGGSIVILGPELLAISAK